MKVWSLKPSSSNILCNKAWDGSFAVTLGLWVALAGAPWARLRFISTENAMAWNEPGGNSNNQDP
ncbi:hypothetical protein, partial [Escherichia coli]